MIKFTTLEDGNGHALEIGKRIIVNTFNEWKQLFQIGRCNWYSFTLAYLAFEYTSMAKSYELTCILFGLGFVLTYDHDSEHSKIAKLVKDAQSEIEQEKALDEMDHMFQNLGLYD